MMDRSGLMGVAGVMGPAGMGAGTMGTPGTMPAGMNMMMVPRCDVKVEKCTGGMTISCTSDDKVVSGMVQNLCTMLAGGMCSCSMILNGVTVCTCCLTMGLCKCEMTDKGCVITCTSGDQKCCEMIQSCCDCLSTLMGAGCTCCVMMNNTPVACGCVEPVAAKAKR